MRASKTRNPRGRRAAASDSQPEAGGAGRQQIAYLERAIACPPGKKRNPVFFSFFYAGDEKRGRAALLPGP